MDYKVRHQCQCLYGCQRQDENRIENGYKVVLPELNTLFDECDWKPFVDTR